MSEKLSPKQKKFVAEYIKDCNGTQAAIRAGYAANSANEQASALLAKPNIKAAVEEKLEKAEDQSLVSKVYVLKGLKEVAERCLQRAPVMVYDHQEKEMVQVKDEEGRDVWQFDSAGANRALELIGKHLKMFTDKKELSLDEDLSELLNAARERTKGK